MEHPLIETKPVPVRALRQNLRYYLRADFPSLILCNKDLTALLIPIPKHSRYDAGIRRRAIALVRRRARAATTYLIEHD